MEIALVILAFIFLLAGFIGSIIPAVPGPPIGYLGLWLLKWSRKADFSYTFLIIWAGITIIVMVADNFLPAIMTKKFGGSKKAVIGSVIGLVVGMFFAPIGLLAGPFFGAFVGELIHSKTEAIRIRKENPDNPEPETINITARNEKALFAAFGAFLAFILGTGAKLIIGGLMIFFSVRAVFL